MKKLQIRLQSFNKNTLKIYSNFLKSILEKYHVKFSYLNNPIRKKRITLLKSPHVHKKAREQFELHVHKKTFFIQNFKQLYNFNQLLINKPKLININLKYIGK